MKKDSYFVGEIVDVSVHGENISVFILTKHNNDYVGVKYDTDNASRSEERTPIRFSYSDIKGLSSIRYNMRVSTVKSIYDYIMEIKSNMQNILQELSLSSTEERATGSDPLSVKYNSMISTINSFITAGNVKLGNYPVETIQEGIDRMEYPNLQEYYDFKRDNILRWEREAKTKSFSWLFTQGKVLTSNESGVFSFERASLNLQPIIKFYSEKYKKYFNPNEVDKKLIDNKYLYFLKEKIGKDDTDKDLIVVPKLYEADGQKKVKSLVKKSYYVYDDVLKQLPAIRLVVSGVIGYGMDWRHIYYSGMTTIALSEILEKIGVKTSIVLCVGVDYSGGYLYVGDDRIPNAQEINVNMVTVKDFGNDVPLPIALHMVADIVSLRVKGYFNLMAMPYLSGDKLLDNDSLGVMLKRPDIVNSIIYKYSKTDMKNRTYNIFVPNMANIEDVSEFLDTTLHKIDSLSKNEINFYKNS